MSCHEFATSQNSSTQQRGKEKLDQLPYWQFLPGFKISSDFLLAKQVGEKHGKIQKIVNIAHKMVVLIFHSL